ncbi:hypothetical protein [Blastococcus sp. URHD0036]|uniref:hypothetical protein n=1 Tax=Blastococcus sp. URHD0036 TaxID=1380356 RepID=UPI000495AC17|nr:hypothetical protein [Blastococcus sp. URHD0036]
MAERGAARAGGRTLLVGLLVAGCGARSGGEAADPEIDWLDTTYTLTCDGTVPGGLAAPVHGGVARVAADPARPPYFEHYDVRVLATPQGDVDGDSAPDTVVLLECSPQPSNGVVQEVQAFTSTGRLLAGVPSPRTLREESQLPPVYVPDRLAVTDGELVAVMSAYGTDDTRADGPSVPLTVRWRYAGGHFVRIATS